MAGTERTPLVLIPGVTLTARSWEPVLPALAEHHEVLALTLPGHRGGPGRVPGDTTMDGLLDWIEARCDERGWARPHVAGNSLGGWLALELARRGRAASVCALAPAGFWTVGAKDMTRPIAVVRRNVRITRATLRATPRLARSARLRRLMMRDVLAFGDRLTPEEVVEIARDVAACATFDELREVREALAPMDPPPCPITVAWAARDRIFPPADYVATSRIRIPGARTLVLPGVGHVPMSDDPALIARTILIATGAMPDAGGTS